MNFLALSHRLDTGAYANTVPYNPRTKKHRQEESRLMAVFEADCRKAVDATLGIATTDPQWQRLFTEAWEEGHSEGWRAVLDILDALVHLILLFMPETSHD